MTDDIVNKIKGFTRSVVCYKTKLSKTYVLIQYALLNLVGSKSPSSERH